MARTAEQRLERGEAQEAILDAAEVVFADNGFHGATTRAIAEHAQANAALIHYYFGSKEALYEAVVSRRSGVINGERRDRLADLHTSGTPTLEQILDALLRPTIALGRDPKQGGAHYARILAHSVSGTDERSKRMARTYYNEIALIFVSEIEAVIPKMKRADAVRGYLNAIAIGLSLMAPTGRADELSGGVLHDDDLEETINQAVRYSAAGIRSLASK